MTAWELRHGRGNVGRGRESAVRHGSGWDPLDLSVSNSDGGEPAVVDHDGGSGLPVRDAERDQEVRGGQRKQRKGERREMAGSGAT